MFVLLLFLPAGSFKYNHAWLLITLLFIPASITGIALMFLLAFILAGLNYRFDWLKVPSVIVIISSFIFLFAYLLFV